MQKIKINIVDDADTVSNTRQLHGRVEEMLVPSANDLRVARHRRRDDQIVVGDLWSGWERGLHRNDNGRTAVFEDRLEIGSNPDIIESMESADAGVLQNACEFHEQREPR